MKRKIFFAAAIISAALFLSYFLARPIANRLIVAVPENQQESQFVSGGDPGEEELLDMSGEISIPSSAHKTRWAFTELALEYNGKIPFADGGRYWQSGYPVFESGIDNRMHPSDSKMGIDSMGYVLWLYRNIFGSHDPRLEKPAAMYGAASVDILNLQVGDVGMVSLKENGNHFGVCIGFLNEHAVFSHCDSSPLPLYPGGATRLSYLAQQTDDYLYGSTPVDFKYFVRPTANWEE